jgi:hypothetical protein
MSFHSDTLIHTLSLLAVTLSGDDSAISPIHMSFHSDTLIHTLSLLAITLSGDDSAISPIHMSVHSDILIHTLSLLAITLSGDATDTNFIVFSLIQLKTEPTTINTLIITPSTPPRVFLAYKRFL